MRMKKHRTQTRKLIAEAIRKNGNKIPFSRIVESVLPSLHKRYVERTDESLQLIVYEELQDMVHAGAVARDRVDGLAVFMLTGKPLGDPDNEPSHFDFGRPRRGRPRTRHLKS